MTLSSHAPEARVSSNRNAAQAVKSFGNVYDGGHFDRRIAFFQLGVKTKAVSKTPCDPKFESLFFLRPTDQIHDYLFVVVDSVPNYILRNLS